MEGQISEGVARLTALASKNTLRVKIKSARNLRDTDWLPLTGSSDPYVRLRIVDDDDHSKVLHTKQTKTLSGLNPEWDEEFTFTNLQDPAALTIKLNVLDKDFLTSDDKLGEASVDLGILSNESGWQDFNDVWIDGYVFKSYLSFSLSTTGGWGNSAGDEDDTLYVSIKQANKLRNAEGWFSGKNDPYCIMYILDAAGSTLAQQQTTVKQEAGQDVEWNEDFVFENLKHPGASRLMLQIFDKDKGRIDDNLGEIVFHLGTLKCHPEPQEFKLPLMKHPGHITFTLDNKGMWGSGKKRILLGEGVLNECKVCTIL